MGSKNISITDEAYEALARERLHGESFTQAIIRLTRRSSKISDCFGKWKMSDEEKKGIFDNELPKGWSRTTSRLRERLE